MITNKQIVSLNTIQNTLLKEHNLGYLENKIKKAGEIIINSNNNEIAKDIIGYWRNPNLIMRDFAKFWIKSSQRLYINKLMDNGLRSHIIDKPAPQVWPYITSTLISTFAMNR